MIKILTVSSRVPLLVAMFSPSAVWLPDAGDLNDQQLKRPVTVTDTIEMTRVAGDAHYRNSPPRPPLAYFSPNGERFVVVLRKGNLERNTNDYSLLLFQTLEVFHSVKPEVLVNMSSSSNLDAIRRVQWVDNEMIAFLGQDENAMSQVYAVDLVSRRLKKLTNHAAPVLDYRINKRGPEIVFQAEGARAEGRREEVKQEQVITIQNLINILAGDQHSVSTSQLFSKKPGVPEVELAENELPKLPEDSLPFLQSREISTPSVILTLEEDLNTPQKLYAIDPTTKQKVLLIDLNPQFSRLEFAKVEAVTWKGTDGKDTLNGGGLYLPLNYVPGTRYPLVIQTHHFQKDIFMIDGPWGSGYAAQPLAGKGFVVLEVHHAEGYYKHTPTESAGEMAMYEGAIDYLDRRGLIDRDHVGIFAFSRTVYHVAYTLTHSKYSFRAAILEDGIDRGYFQYLAYPLNDVREYESIYGGSAWGPAQVNWIKDSPGFNLDKVRTPIRIVEHGPRGVLQQWEWFCGLNLLHKPVEMVILPNLGFGEHLLKRPAERMAAQQGTVDWFRFWLKGEEDSDPAKAAEYERWRELRRLQAENQATRSQPASP